MLKKCNGLFLTVFVLFDSLDAVSEYKLCFPQNFIFGVATASYQIEGAWNASGKGESIWDRYTHQHSELVFDHTNGDVADDSYHLYTEDVKLIKELGASFYRFSISWPRILPTGYSNYINEDGIRYYNNLLDELRKNNIVPLVTMYHWDLPQKLQEIGGWTNPLLAEYFVDYARILFEFFGDKVQHWITINEPLSFCLDGYGGIDAPGTRSSGIESYMCGHNVLRAHGMVYRMYDAEFRNKQKGSVGITLNSPWMQPASQSKEDREAAETAIQFSLGWFAHPIFSQNGDYPPVMRKRIDEISKHQKFPRSRLPTFTQDELKIIRGAYDFLGYNHYTTCLAKPRVHRYLSQKPSYNEDVGVEIYASPDWPTTNSTWLRVVPWGFRKILNWIKNTYNNPIVMITENGVSYGAGLNDVKRVEYIGGYLRNLHAAVTRDRCNVIGYTYWSLLDNFEWMRGFSERFGLYEVDYTSPSRTRTARLSAEYFHKIATTGCIPNSWATTLNLVEDGPLFDFEVY